MPDLVHGVPDYRSDVTQLVGVAEGVKAIRESQAAEPQWVGAFTPIAFWSDQLNAMSWRSLVVVGAGSKLALSQRTDGQWDTVLLARWWIRWRQVTPSSRSWLRQPQRFFVYSMDDEGCVFELEFASAIEARVFANGMDEHAVGQAQAIPTMPMLPQLRLSAARPSSRDLKRRR